MLPAIVMELLNWMMGLDFHLDTRPYHTRRRYDFWGFWWACHCGQKNFLSQPRLTKLWSIRWKTREVWLQMPCWECSGKILTCFVHFLCVLMSLGAFNESVLSHLFILIMLIMLKALAVSKVFRGRKTNLWMIFHLSGLGGQIQTCYRFLSNANTWQHWSALLQ